MKSFRKTLITLTLVLLLIVAGGFFLPAKVHVERAIVIDQPVDHVYRYLSDLRNFQDWSPWAELDPDAAYRYSGARSGQGAKMSWDSEHGDVGSGSQEIIGTRDNQLIMLQLRFGEDQGGLAYYRLTPVAGGTQVNWEFDTDFGNNPIGRYFGLLMDGILGPLYEKGLSSLKQQLEGNSAIR